MAIKRKRKIKKKSPSPKIYPWLIMLMGGLIVAIYFLHKDPISQITPISNTASVPITSVSQRLPTETALPTLPSQEIPSNWNTYTGTNIKFTLRYPPGYKVAEYNYDSKNTSIPSYHEISVSPEDKVFRHGVSNYLLIIDSDPKQDFSTTVNTLKNTYRDDVARRYAEIDTYSDKMVIQFLPKAENGLVKYRRTYLNFNGKSLEMGYSQVTTEEANNYEIVISSIKPD